MKELEVNESLVSLLSSALAKKYRVIPWKMENDVFFLYADLELEMQNSRDDLSVLLDKNISMTYVETSFIESALNRLYLETDVLNDFQFSISRGLADLIMEAQVLRASDVHIEAFEDLYRIRFRIDGKLIERHLLNQTEFKELNNRIKIEANLDITEKRVPQDGRIRNSSMDLRVSVLPTLHGEKTVIRILGNDASQLELESLGFSSKDLKMFKKSIDKPNGIVLISGPTGSGKTTTLYASLNRLNDVAKNIVTIEDPIEYTLKGINQVQLREDVGLTFDGALKSFLRQDPDIIMLGEIRDSKTAQMAMRASLTGHLVLSTIHTNSAKGIISRLLDMGIPPFLISDTLNLAVAQRLIRKLCNNCKTLREDSSLLCSKLGIESCNIFEAVGCKMCNQIGFKGRIAVYDLLEIDESIIQMLRSESNASFLKEENSKLEVRALEVLSKGMTSISEVQSIIQKELI
ncbi:general secretion pathway protein E/type IV pilus assembly protein PilB [Nonlabens xylanidelens]|uniref:General secretion pathway protein E/type IV pilus assembly protein PilB n=2 Tax=Nonlabens xylanidelens TaxID=191564 RepID=A0A2S6IFT1_9FLAO|nr:GspE/PulE family protein [Nonlabens xylanidelens]PPK93074.1 general secretion pathway protein E/type IV pilus assembly protein PilB [Nonlabens xylanidelens]PQJ19623.1 hypothetical protein BST94_06485 [Nonlabens xylanidelens]PQJ19871.1 hypothetical protein BST94_06450 [Nonlabens xylanidelens]